MSRIRNRSALLSILALSLLLGVACRSARDEASPGAGSATTEAERSRGSVLPVPAGGLCTEERRGCAPEPAPSTSSAVREMMPGSR
jgi:hypothetical protein